MTILTIDIIFDQAALNLIYQNVGQIELERRVMQPELARLAWKLELSARGELDAPIKYHGDMQRGLSGRKQGNSQVVITQSAGHDIPVRFGTSGPYQGFPVPVKTWAMEKLGLSAERAGAIAKMVEREGTSRFFEGYYPVGGRGFDYPEYIVKEKELQRIQQAGGQMGVLAIRYALGKAGANP
jgi:hypothetical protein